MDGPKIFSRGEIFNKKVENFVDFLWSTKLIFPALQNQDKDLIWTKLSQVFRIFGPKKMARFPIQNYHCPLKLQGLCFKQHNNHKKSISEIFSCDQRFQKFRSCNYLKCINYTYCDYGFMLCDLLHAILRWMPSVCHIPNYYLQNCVCLY